MNRIFRSSRKSSGFTLIEILVVLVIVGLLAALIFPVFLSARKNARMTVCTSNLRQIGQAIQMYQADNSGGFPMGSQVIWRQGIASLGEPERVSVGRTAGPLEAYGATKDILHCPEAPAQGQEQADFFGYQWRTTLDLSNIHAKQNDETRQRRVKLEPNSVLAFCIRHLTKGYTSYGNGSYSYSTWGIGQRQGTYLVLRDSGAVQRIPAERVRVASYEQVSGVDKWSWLPPHGPAIRGLPTAWQNFDVFPDEPWPPKFEER